MQFSFVTSKPGIKTDADQQYLDNSGAKDVCVIGIPVESGVYEQPFGKQTEQGAFGRVTFMEDALTYFATGVHPKGEVSEALQKSLDKARKAIDAQIGKFNEGKDPSEQISWEQILDKKNRHSVVSYENGMMTVAEAEERGVKNVQKAKEMGSDYIDTCACVVIKDGVTKVGYDEGLPVRPEHTIYLDEARRINSQNEIDGKPLTDGITATQCMVNSGVVQNEKGQTLSAELAQDPHKFFTDKPRSEFLAAGVAPVFAEVERDVRIKERYAANPKVQDALADVKPSSKDFKLDKEALGTHSHQRVTGSLAKNPAGSGMAR